MSAIPVVVVKVGGSLLEWAELPQRLNSWLRAQPAGLHLLVAGTGSLGDFVRRADKHFHLGEQTSHWLCVDALPISMQVLSHVLEGAPIVGSLAAAAALRDRPLVGTFVFDLREFLRTEEARQPGMPLPHTWDVTTDSIAARLAECVQADLLVLLKSGDVPQPSVTAACAAGFVDRQFAFASQSLRRVAYVNLRRGSELVELQRANR